MTVAYRSSATNTVASSASVACNVPAGTANGDCILFAITVAGAQTITTPAGLTLVRDDASGTDIHTSLYSRVALSEPASYTFALSGSTSAAAVASAYAGCDTTTPVASGNGQGNASGTSCAAPGVTGLGNGAVVGFFSCAGSNSGWTLDAHETSRAASANNRLLSGDEATAGATGTRTSTIGGGIGSANVGQLVVLQPPVIVDPPPPPLMQAGWAFGGVVRETFPWELFDFEV